MFIVLIFSVARDSSSPLVFPSPPRARSLSLFLCFCLYLFPLVSFRRFVRGAHFLGQEVIFLRGMKIRVSFNGPGYLESSLSLSLSRFASRGFSAAA